MEKVVRAKFLKMIREDGLALQTYFPEVRTLYAAGLCNRVIAHNIHQNEEFCREMNFVYQKSGEIYSEATISGIVRCAIVGSRKHEPIYNGLISLKDYNRYAHQHQSNGAKRKLDVVERRGAFSAEKCIASARKLNEKLGKQEWQYQEAQYAWQLKDDGYTAPEIVQILNIEEHGGKEVRTLLGLESFFQRPEVRKKYPRKKPIA